MTVNHDAACRGEPAPSFLADWVLRQRWYASKDHRPELRSIGSWTLPSDEPAVRVRTHLILDAASERAELYQVPVTERMHPLTGEQGLIARVNGRDGERYWYDGPHDQAYTRALLALIAEDGRSDETADASAQGRAFASAASGGKPTARGTTMISSRVLGGEQSNTSIVIDLVDGDLVPAQPIICKVFRMLHHGENPDVAVQLALAGAGSRYIPWPIGQVLGDWDDPALPGGRATGHLAFAQEFLPGVEDAWRVALRAAESGDDLTERVRALGRATADVHESLSRVMPTSEAADEIVAEIIDTMRRRQRMAEREVPSLAPLHAEIEAVFAAAQTAAWPLLQRIHGDYHLGQVLNAPGRGWVLIDFEGEPLRPMNERNRPDVTLRDVAGMLRSFSYVAGAVTMERAASGAGVHDVGEKNPQAWAFACRSAFLDGYAERAGHDPRSDAALLDAFELDKALYEAVYETRNRPDWVSIPLTAIRRLIADEDGTSGQLRAYA